MRKEEYGFRTLHTHNAKHKASSPLMRELARRWGLANNFKGEAGGWIYDAKGQHIAHGWGQFFFVYGNTIRKWAEANGLIKKDQKL